VTVALTDWTHDRHATSPSGDRQCNAMSCIQNGRTSLLVVLPRTIRQPECLGVDKSAYMRGEMGGPDGLTTKSVVANVVF